MRPFYTAPLLASIMLTLTACPTGTDQNNKGAEDCIESIVLCDPQDGTNRRRVDYNECTGNFTSEDTCPVGTLCDDQDPKNPDGVIAATCVDPLAACGEAEALRVCDPERPNDVYFSDECGNLGGVAEDCMDSSSECVEEVKGEATCLCEVLPKTYCKYPPVAINYYDTSFVVQRDTCGNEIVVDECEFGARCYSDESGDYNGGEARCERSLDASQADSPYYDYGCFFFSELTEVKTSLAADCRCRAVTQGGGATVFVEASTMTNPTGKLPNCQNVSMLQGKTFDPPLGSGPQFNAWGISGNDRWYGNWFDAQTRKFYGLVSWTDSTHRAAGSIVSFDVDTGAREVITGIYPDVRQGEVMYGSGYESPNDIPAGPATQPLSAVAVFRPGPDRKIYTLGIGTTGEGQSRSAEIVRVDPETGARELVWQSLTVERGEAATSAFGQCISDSTPDTSPRESVTIVSRSFEVDEQGNFFMSFYDRVDGTGIIKVSADGSTCEFIARFNAEDTSKNIGSGYTSQAGARLRGMLLKDGAVYTATTPWSEFLRIDIATGDRIAVSIKGTGYSGLGEDVIIFDETRQLFYTTGSPAVYGGGIIEESTGKRQNPFGDSETVGLVDSIYDVRRDVTSYVGGPLVQANYHGNGPFALDPDDPDIAWFILKGGALLKMEWSTFNNMITSY